MSNFVKLISGQNNNTIMAGSLTITDTTPSVNTSTGALVVAGGAGVAGSLYATNIYLGGIQVPTNATMSNAINSATSPLALAISGMPTLTGSNTLTGLLTANGGLTVSGTITLPANSIPSTAISGLTTAINNAVGSSYPTLTGSNTLTGLLTANGGLTVTGTITVPANSIPSTAISGLTTAINNAIGSSYPTLTGSNTLTGVNTFSNTLVCNNLINATAGLYGGMTAIAQQGTYINWCREPNLGKAYIINQKGGGTGGTSFGECTTGNVYTENMFLSATGNLSITGAYGCAYTTVPSFASTHIGYKLFAQQGTNTTMASTNSIISGITVTIPVGVWLINYSLNVQYQTTSGTGTVYHGVGTSGSPSVYIANNAYCVLGQAVLTGMVVQTITSSTVVYASAYYASATFAAPAVSGSIFATRIA